MLFAAPVNVGHESGRRGVDSTRRRRRRTEVCAGHARRHPPVLPGHLHHPPQPRLLGPPHEEEDWQVSEEEHPYPVGHGVRARAPEVPVDDDDGDEDGHGVHDEGEEQVLGDERQHQRGRGQDL